MTCVKKISYLSVVLILQACGGGDGGDTSKSNISSVSIPSVTITLSKSEFTEGDTITVNWTSTNASSCRATGLISGSLETSGKRDVVLEKPGSSEIVIECSNSTKSESSKVTLNVIEKPYFVAVKNALSTDQPFQSTIYFAVNPLDVNNDGKDDLIVHMWSWDNFQKYVGDVPCAEIVRVFVYQSDHTFQDQTTVYLPFGNKLNGCSRKVEVGDVNNDGKLDLVYALNQEDQRLGAGDNMHYAESQLGALISNGNIYTIKNFGDKAWYHAVGIGRDETNKPYVVGAGYSRLVYDKHYFDLNANVTSIKRNKPKLAPNTFLLYNPDGSHLHSTHLIQELGLFEVEGHTKINNQWTTAGKINTLELSKVVRHCYNSVDCGDVNVFKFGERFLSFGGYNESCSMKIHPNNKEIVVLQGTGAIIGFDGNKITIPERSKPISFFKAFEIDNNKLKEVPLNIKDEQVEDINSNFFDCKDINNDGYIDLIKYPYNKTGLPFVYLNNKNNGFEYIGNKMFPDTSNDWATEATTLLHDFDKDGVADLLVWPGTPVNFKDKVSFQYYRGNKKLVLNQ